MCGFGTRLFYLTYKVRQSLGILIGTTVLLRVCCLVTDVSVASEYSSFHQVAHFGVIFVHEIAVKSERQDGLEDWWGHETEFRQRVFNEATG